MKLNGPNWQERDDGSIVVEVKPDQFVEIETAIRMGLISGPDVRRVKAEVTEARKRAAKGG